MLFRDYEGVYTTIIRKDSSRFMLISKQHECITDIDKISLILFLVLLPFNRFVTIDTHPFLIAYYYLLLGIFFGRSSNLIIFSILTQPKKLLVISYVICLLFL